MTAVATLQKGGDGYCSMRIEYPESVLGLHDYCLKNRIPVDIHVNYADTSFWKDRPCGALFGYPCLQVKKEDKEPFDSQYLQVSFTMRIKRCQQTENLGVGDLVSTANPSGEVYTIVQTKDETRIEEAIQGYYKTEQFNSLMILLQELMPGITEQDLFKRYRKHGHSSVLVTPLKFSTNEGLLFGHTYKHKEVVETGVTVWSLKMLACDIPQNLEKLQEMLWLLSTCTPQA